MTVIFALHETIKSMSVRKLKNSIGEKVRALRLEKGLSQEELAEYVNISQEHISCIERSKNLASIETLLSFAEYFKINIKDFFDFIFGYL